MKRWAATLGTGAMLAIAALPFVVLFPEPPAFGRPAGGLVAAFIVLATVGTAYRAGPVRRARIVRRCGAMLAITVVSVGLRILAGLYSTDIKTFDVLSWLFGLEGEDIIDAFLYEGWLEVWLACAATVIILTRLFRAFSRGAAKAAIPGPWDGVVPQALPAPRWHGATILLWFVGCGALGGAVLVGHRTAAFLSGCVHTTGMIADPQPHPLIEFTAQDGAVVQFVQNGFVSRELGAEVPVAYQTQDPAGTARADTFWANWSDVLGLAWVGLGLTLAPFFSFTRGFQARRW